MRSRSCLERNECEHSELRAGNSVELLRAVDAANVFRHLNGHLWQDLSAKLLHECTIAGVEIEFSE